MKFFIYTLFTCLIFSSSYSFSQNQEPIFATIEIKNVMLYERPSTESPVVRRVFPGEVLKIVSTIKNENGETWGKVYLSPTSEAYIQTAYLSNSGTLKQEIWKPQEILRNQMPMSFSLKGQSEYFGYGLQFRYLPFSRLGFNLGIGSIVDRGALRSSITNYGAIFMLSTNNISPFVETGTSVLTFNDRNSSLRISTFYVNVGVEWILRQGYFFGIGLSYNKSYEVQVSYDYSYAKQASGSISIGNYGSFNDLNEATSLQKVNPLLILGYSF